MLPPASFTKLFARDKPKPVFTTTPTIIPAQAVAAATANADRAPSTHASINSFTPNLTSGLIRPTTTHEIMPYKAA